jgi:hypothetical protein
MTCKVFYSCASVAHSLPLCDCPPPAPLRAAACFPFCHPFSSGLSCWTDSLRSCHKKKKKPKKGYSLQLYLWRLLHGYKMHYKPGQLPHRDKQLIMRETRWGMGGSGEPHPYYKNMCSACSRSVSSSPGAKENLFICSLHMHSCDQSGRWQVQVFLQ